MCLCTIEGTGKPITFSDWFETVKDSKEEVIIVSPKILELPCGCKKGSEEDTPFVILNGKAGVIHLINEGMGESHKVYRL